jgi:hypothetical protein
LIQISVSDQISVRRQRGERMAMPIQPTHQLLIHPEAPLKTLQQSLS